MLINCQFDAEKAASNTKRQNFASNYTKLQIIKPHYVKIMHFKKLQIELENF